MRAPRASGAGRHRPARRHHRRCSEPWRRARGLLLQLRRIRRARDPRPPRRRGRRGGGDGRRRRWRCQSEDDRAAHAGADRRGRQALGRISPAGLIIGDHGRRLAVSPFGWGAPMCIFRTPSSNYHLRKGRRPSMLSYRNRSQSPRVPAPRRGRGRYVAITVALFAFSGVLSASSASAATWRAGMTINNNNNRADARAAICGAGRELQSPIPHTLAPGQSTGLMTWEDSEKNKDGSRRTTRSGQGQCRLHGAHRLHRHQHLRLPRLQAANLRRAESGQPCLPLLERQRGISLGRLLRDAQHQ